MLLTYPEPTTSSKRSSATDCGSILGAETGHEALQGRIRPYSYIEDSGLPGYSCIISRWRSGLLLRSSEYISKGHFLKRMENNCQTDKPEIETLKHINSRLYAQDWLKVVVAYVLHRKNAPRNEP